jgi:hypothetical protein
LQSGHPCRRDPVGPPTDLSSSAQQQRLIERPRGGVEGFR